MNTWASPVHPARSFRGKEQVRRNWTQFLAASPDMKASIERYACDGDVVWTEWTMTGAKHDMRGVFIFGVEGDLVRWGRMFLEPVDR